MINNLYYGSDNADIDRFRNASFTFDTDVLATFLRRIYNGFDTSNDVEPTMWREILRIINEATVDGLVQGNYDTNIDKTFLEKLAHSNEVFSAFKVHNMGVDMAKKMRTDEGKLKPFSEWKKDIKSIASHYCGAWLQTEYNTATLRAKFAAEWKQYEADADIMPNLRWMPTTSANPEEEHKVYWMNRLTLPVGDKFWDKHHPGDHWNCKCSLEQTDEPANPDVLSHIPDVKPQKGLASNPGKTGEMFDKSHPYIAGCDKKEQEAVMKSLDTIKKGRTREEILEAAKKRHAARTQEEEEKIRKAWEERAIKRSPLNSVIEAVDKTKAKYLQVATASTPRTEDEIIQYLGGGDMTMGSCSSLAFAYAGNKGGMSVLDFRGGDSCKFFATSTNIKEITQKVGGLVEKDTDDIKASIRLLKQVQKGKEYYFTTGAHAAIIRRTDNDFEYLELQSRTNNGWHKLDNEALKRRFRAKKQHTFRGMKYETTSELIDIDLLNADAGFRKMLGYINTEDSKQQKGAQGYSK